MTKLQTQFVIMTLVISIVASATAVVIVATNPLPVVAQKAIPTNKIANGNVTMPKIASQSVTTSKIQGLTRLIFAGCNLNFGTVNPHADGLADCSVPGTVAGDNVVASPNNGMWDAFSFYDVSSLDGKVRILVHNNSDNILQGLPTTWSVIVFHK
jgi:hypothetical protein